MAEPTSTPSSERIPLHSALAKPGLCVLTGVHVLGTLGQVKVTVVDDVAMPIAGVVLLAFGSLIIWKMWSLYQRVYMTREGIELTRPPRLVPWSKVGDAFRSPMTGLPPICCIGIRDPETWDLHFIGRLDFEHVIREGRAK
jgi:hypothetical protein